MSRYERSRPAAYRSKSTFHCDCMNAQASSVPWGWTATDEIMRPLSWGRTCFVSANTRVFCKSSFCLKLPSARPMRFFSSCSDTFLYIFRSFAYSFAPPFLALRSYTIPRRSAGTGFVSPLIESNSPWACAITAGSPYFPRLPRTSTFRSASA